MPLNNYWTDRGTSGDEGGSGSLVVDQPGEDTSGAEEEEPLPDNSFEEDDGEAYKLVEEVLARRSQPTAQREEESQWFILDDVDDVEEDSEDDKEDEEDL